MIAVICFSLRLFALSVYTLLMSDEPKPTQPSNVTNVTHGGIKLEKDASITVGQGDVVAGDKIVTVVNQIVQGLGDLPTHYDGYVRNFLDYYLGTPDRPAPFGGRKADLAALDAWLADPNAPRYALMVAPAGRGKSALLAHWVTQLAAHPDQPHVVYFPVSIRFNTNLESVAFASLAARIAHVYGEKVAQAINVQLYRGLFSDYLRRPPPDGRRVLVVLDGLDEAAAWEAGADLFPHSPPEHLRVVVAARPLAGDVAERSWLSRLGWDAPGRAKSLPLAALDRDGVSDVLAQMGNPLDALATRMDVVGKLHELSEGDPLLVRLYVEALLPRGSEAATFKPEDLLTLKPGLKPYFDLWFKQQESLWASAAERIDHDAVDDLLNLCATALGPLTKDDSRALVPERLKNSRTIERTVEAVNRFAIGDGTEASGYVFSHPRLREYFAERLTPRERKEWDARFLHYGKETLTALEARTLKPGEAPAYAVKYYGAHLVRANAPAADFYALMCEGWLRAWEWADGTPDGFLNDANRAWARAEVEGPPALGQIVRAALCFSSVVSVSANVPNELIVACLKAGVINPRLALVMARAKPEAKERVECLAKVSEFLPSDDQRRALADALNAARDVGNEYLRAEALCAIAPCLPPEATDLLAEALRVARAISAEEARAQALHAIVERLRPDATNLLGESLRIVATIDHYRRDSILCAIVERLPPEATGLLAEALRIVDAYNGDVLNAITERLPPDAADLLTNARLAADVIGDRYFHTFALHALAQQHLPPDEERRILAGALNAARTIDDEYRRVSVLRAIAVCLPPQATDLLAEALRLTRAIGGEYHRVFILIAIAERLPPDEQRQELAQALRIARAIDNEFNRAKAFRIVVQRLPPEATNLLVEALRIAHTAGNEWFNASALSAIAERLPPDVRRWVLAEALLAARSIGDEGGRALALIDVAKCLPPDEQQRVLAEALSVAQEVGREDDRAIILGVVAESLPSEATDLLAEALRVARAIDDEHCCVSVLRAIVKRLPSEATDLLTEALHIARAISNKHDRREALNAIAERLPLEATDLLAEALRIAFAIGVHNTVLGAIVNRLPPDVADLLTNARRAANIIGDRYFLTFALHALAQQHLPPDEERRILAEALNATRAIVFPDEDHRVPVLRAIAACLPPEATDLLAEALRIASTIKFEDDRAEALCAIAEYLPPEATDLLTEAVRLASTFFLNQYHRVSVLIAVAERLPPEKRWRMLIEVLSSTRAIDDKDHRVSIAIAERLPPDEQRRVLTEALYSTRVIGDGDCRPFVLSAIAKYLPPTEQRWVLTEARRLARAIDNKSRRIPALIAIAERLPPDAQQRVLAETLHVARAIDDEVDRAEALRAIAERLPPLEQRAVLTEALSAARTVQGKKSDRAFALSAVAKYLPPKERRVVLAEALSVAQTASDEHSRTHALSAIAEHLPPEEQRAVLAEALSAARAIEDEESRARVLSAVAERLLPEERRAVRAEALSAARAVSNKYYRSLVLSAVAKHLPLEEQRAVLAEALSAARAIGDEWLHAYVLSVVAERLLPEETDLQRKLLQEACSLTNKSAGTGILQYLAPHWSAMCRANQLSEFGELSVTLRVFAVAKRENLLPTIEALLPLIARLGSERAVWETAQAIMDTAKWWP